MKKKLEIVYQSKSDFSHLILFLLVFRSENIEIVDPHSKHHCFFFFALLLSHFQYLHIKKKKTS